MLLAVRSMEGLDAWPCMMCILAAGELRRHSRGRARRRMLGLRLGAAVHRRAACGTNSCCRGQQLRGAHGHNACRQQQLRARHGHPADSTAGKEAHRGAASGAAGEPTANGRVAQVTVPALPIFKLPLPQAICTAL